MIKETFPNTELTCVSQESEMNNEQCRTGILSMREDGTFFFEESVRKSQISRNPKLFDGNFISLVRRKDGCYQIHLKAVCVDHKSNAKKLAKGISKEIAQAVEVVNQ